LLEFATGIEFSRGGVSSPDEPAIAIRDLTGALTAWIDVGTPDAERLHKASKLAGRVAVYTHKDPAQFLKQLAGKKIHNAEALEIYALDRELVNALVARLERRLTLTVSVSGGELYVSIGDETITGSRARLRPQGETRAARTRRRGANPEPRIPAQLILSSPSVSSMYVPQGSVMKAIEILRAGTWRYGDASLMPCDSSFFVNASGFLPSNPT